MGTKIQPNGFLRGHHSVIDLEGSPSDGVRSVSVCNGNELAENGKSRELLTPLTFGNEHLQCGLEKVRQTILEQESAFKGQLQELHRLYKRQKELMNEAKTREINKVAVKEVRSSQSSILFSLEDANRTRNTPYLMAGCSSASGNSSKSFPTFLEGKVVPSFPPVQDMRILSGCEPWLSKSSFCPKGAYGPRYTGIPKLSGVNRDTRLSLTFAQTSQCNANAVTLDLYPKRNDSEGDICVTGQRDGIPDNLMLARGAPADSSSTFNLSTKDFFRSVQDRTNGGTSLIAPGFSREKCSNNLAERARFNKHASIGDFSVGKSPSFPQQSLAEPNKELPQRKRKIFGVEIEEYDSPSTTIFKMSKTSEPYIVSGPSSWIDRSFVNNLEFNGKINANGGNTETRQADSKGENRKWLQGCSDVRLGLDKVSEPRKCIAISKPPEVLRTVHTDSQNKENPKGALPWFLRNSQERCGSSKEAKSSYFMNLDSLQSCSQNFFRKTETADGVSPSSMQKSEVAPAVANESSTGTTKLLGFPISGVLQSSKDPRSKDDLTKVSNLGPDVDSPRKSIEAKNEEDDLQNGINNISDLRHHIDLNYSLDEEATPTAPSLPTTVVKIATTEIDLEAPAVIESEMDASPKESDSSKMNVPLVSEEHDQLAAEALLAISMDNNSVNNGAHGPPEAASSSSSSLKWFAEIVSSQCQQGVAIPVKEEFIPDSMDYFEYMTLKLEETKEDEHYQYEPITLHNPTDDDTGNSGLLKRPQRGQSRRGRQRKDFQRDILPGMITLARLEVTEDLQTFDELMKAEGGNSSRQSGFTHRSSTRNGRGRKRPRGPRIRQQQPNCQLENRSLTGWGKKTRRLPRQRCHNSFLAFPVKC